MDKKQTTVITLLALGAIILGMLVSSRIWFRLDLSRNQAYTLSEVARNLYREIPETVTITYYLSEKLTRIHPVPGEIRELLQEFSSHSRGRIRLVIQDPVKSATVAAAERLGVLPQQIQTMEKDQASVATVYTGLVIEYLNQTDVLPIVFSTGSLEYDLTSRIRALVRGREREVGVLVAAADKNWSQDFNYLEQTFVQAGYRIRQIPGGAEIPDTLPLLFVFGGVEELDDWALYRINHYVLSGGKALFAVDGVFIDSRADLAARPMNDAGLLSLLAAWGVRVEPKLVLDKAALTIPYRSSTPGGGSQVRLVRYPHWVAVLDKNGNQDHPVSANFGGLDLFWPSPLLLDPPAGVQAEILASSTAEAWRMTKDFVANPDASLLFSREEAQTKGPAVLAAALSGRFPDWFADRPQPTRPGSSESLPERPVQAQESRVLVIGDSDLATGLIQYTQSQRNLDFLLECADWLGNDDDILGIHNRARGSGRLDKISDPVQRARAAGFAQSVNLLFIPLLTGVIGLVRYRARRRGKSRREAAHVV